MARFILGSSPLGRPCLTWHPPSLHRVSSCLRVVHEDFPLQDPLDGEERLMQLVVPGDTDLMPRQKRGSKRAQPDQKSVFESKHGNISHPTIQSKLRSDDKF